MTKLFHSFPHSFPSPFPTFLLRFQLVQVLSLTLMFVWKNDQTTIKPRPKPAPPQVWVLVLNVFISDRPCEKSFLLQMALRQCTSSHCQVSSEHCPEGQSEGKGICDQVPQATTDPHSPEVPFSSLQWEVSCFILCCPYLFCQSRTLCLVVQGLEGPKCAMSSSLNVPALCQ